MADVKLWLSTVYATALLTCGCSDSGDPGGDLCADRAGGALITLDIAGADEETLTVWSENDDFIAEARALEGTGEQLIPMFNDLVEGRDCDAQWSWHVDPMDMTWAEAAIELCDAVPSGIESNKSYWLDTVDQYCPWGASVSRVALQ
jgi:hypothetical protein